MIDWIPASLDKGKPRYKAIADAIAEDIRAGRLDDGARLPRNVNLRQNWALISQRFPAPTPKRKRLAMLKAM